MEELFLDIFVGFFKALFLYLGAFIVWIFSYRFNKPFRKILKDKKFPLRTVGFATSALITVIGIVVIKGKF